MKRKHPVHRSAETTVDLMFIKELNIEQFKHCSARELREQRDVLLRALKDAQRINHSL